MCGIIRKISSRFEDVTTLFIALTFAITVAFTNMLIMLTQTPLICISLYMQTIEMQSVGRTTYDYEDISFAVLNSVTLFGVEPMSFVRSLQARFVFHNSLQMTGMC